MTVFVQVANNYEEDEMAAAWNSCVRLSCLEHGMTVHTNFDLVRSSLHHVVDLLFRLHNTGFPRYESRKLDVIMWFVKTANS